MTRGTTSAWLPGLGLIAVFAALSRRMLGDFDLPWHLAMGRVVASTRSLPKVDDLAFTHRPIQYTEFVSDLTLYAAHQLAGPLGIQVLVALAVVATAGLVWACQRKVGPMAWVAVALSLAAMNAWLIARPATFGFCMLAAALFLFETHRAAPTTRGGTRALFSLVPLFVLWANVHPSVFLGVSIAVGYAGYRLVCRYARGRGPAGLLPLEEGVDAYRTVLVCLAAVLASTLNTGGLTLLLGPLRAREHFARVTEWVSPSSEFLFRIEPACGALMVVVVAALVFGHERHGRVPRAYDLGLVVIAFAISATAVRLIAFGAILVGPFVARRLAGFVRNTRLMQGVATISLVVVGLMMFVRSYVGIGVGFEPKHFPEGAVRYIEANEPRGHMYNFMPFGGYLSWRLHPKHRVLVDGRQAFVHDSQLVARVHQSNFEPDVFRGLVGEFDIQWAVIRSREGEPFGMPLARSKDFAMVFFDDVGAIYVRRPGVNERLVVGGYARFRHLMPLSVPIQEAMGGKFIQEWSRDGALAARQAPRSPRAQVLDACGALATKDRLRFEGALGRLGQLAPGHPALQLLERLWAERTQ